MKKFFRILKKSFLFCYWSKLPDIYLNFLFSMVIGDFQLNENREVHPNSNLYDKQSVELHNSPLQSS